MIRQYYSSDIFSNVFNVLSSYGVVENRGVYQKLGERRVRHGEIETTPDEQPGSAQTQHSGRRFNRVWGKVQRCHGPREKSIPIRSSGVPTD